MNEEHISRLIEDTFSRLACPTEGSGLYAEIEKAIMTAYDMGKTLQAQPIATGMETFDGQQPQHYNSL